MRRRVVNYLLCSLFGACSVSNTGNPATTGGEPPEGLTLLRSEVERDISPELSDSEREQFARDQRQFTFALFDLLGLSSPNLFYSPYSIGMALAMSYGGADGETKSEMASALSFSLPEPTLHAAFNATDLALAERARQLPAGETADGFELTTTNAHFAEKSYDFRAEYLDLLAQNYGSGLYLANFAGAPEHERQAINDWARAQTQERIKQLLPERSIDNLTKLVLVNAIYFKGSWQRKFDPKDTQDATFHAPHGDQSVPMMHSAADRLYARGDSYQAVELPYVSNAVRMLLVLPDEGKQAEIEGRLKDGLFDEVRTGLSEYTVDLRLPRFSFGSELDLIPVLKMLGMKHAFDEADFSGIGGPPGALHLSGVFHQSRVAVDERGTEAAAATAVVLSGRSIKQQVAVTVDRPFLFAIYDAPTGAILFAGRLSEIE